MAISPPTLTKAQRGFLLTVGGLTPAHLTPGTKEYEQTLAAYRATVTDPTKAPTFRQAMTIKQQLGLPKGPIKPTAPVIDQMLGPQMPTGVTLTLTPTEHQQLQARQAQATCEADRMACEPTTFKATLKGGGFVYVEAARGDKKAAEQKATAAGYDVQRITWSPNYAQPSPAPIPTGINAYMDKQGSYDLVGLANAYRTKEVSGDQLATAFGSKGAHEIVVVSDILKKLEPYKTGDGYLLSAALADRTVNQYEANKVFPPSTVDSAVAVQSDAAALGRYKDNAGNYDFIAISEALGKGHITETTISSVFGPGAAQEAQDVAAILKKLEPHKTTDGYLVTDAIQKGDISEAEAARIFSPDTIAQARGWIAVTQAPGAEEWGAGVPTTVATKTTQLQKPGAAVPWKQVGMVAAEVVVPYLYVAKHWDTLPTWEKALWIAIDTALFIVPMAGAGIRGARGVATAAAQAGRLGRAARVAGAAKGVAREAWVMVSAPVQAVLHPVAATKQAVRDTRSLLENILRRKAIPEAVLTTTEGTVRLNLTKATSVDEYMRARDALIKAAAQGDTPLVTLKGKDGKAVATLQLQQAPLMREVKGGVVHTTPWGEKFRYGLTVEARPNMRLAEQGIFVAHEPIPRFARESAFALPVELGRPGPKTQTIITRFAYAQEAKLHLAKSLPDQTIQALAKAKLIETGDDLIQPLTSRKVRQLVDTLRQSGNAKIADAFQQTVDSYKPIFRIMSPDKADDIIRSGKTYAGTVEMEARLPVGAKIDPPKQILYTRIGPEATQVQLWLDKPLTARQIIKLKAEGLLEVFRQPFRFPLKIKGKGAALTPTQIETLAMMVRKAGNPKVARNLERLRRLSQDTRRLANIAGKAAAVAVTRDAERLAAISRADATHVVKPAEWLTRLEGPDDIFYIREGKGRILRGPDRTPQRRGVRARAARARPATRVARGDVPARTTRIPDRERLPRQPREPRGARPIRPVRTQRPVRPVRPTRPIRPTKATRRFVLEPTKDKQRRIRSGPALAVWKQGAYWVSVFPPFRTTGRKEDVVYSRQRPKHGTVLAKGKYSPMVTLRSIGKVPELVEVPMGVVTARIRRGQHLTFHRRNGRRRGRIIE